jgi:hypothetical protein
MGVVKKLNIFLNQVKGVVKNHQILVKGKEVKTPKKRKVSLMGYLLG